MEQKRSLAVIVLFCWKKKARKKKIPAKGRVALICRSMVASAAIVASKSGRQSCMSESVDTAFELRFFARKPEGFVVFRAGP